MSLTPLMQRIQTLEAKNNSQPLAGQIKAATPAPSGPGYPALLTTAISITPTNDGSWHTYSASGQIPTGVKFAWVFFYAQAVFGDSASINVRATGTTAPVVLVLKTISHGTDSDLEGCCSTVCVPLDANQRFDYQFVNVSGSNGSPVMNLIGSW